MGTAMFAVRAQLHTLLTEEFTEPGVNVDYGLPGFEDPVDIRIRGSVAPTDEQSAVIGAGSRREVFDTAIDVVLWDASGTDSTVLHADAEEISARLAAAIDDGGTLGGLLDLPLEVVSTEIPDGVLPGESSGLGLLTTVTVRARARTRPN